MNGAMHLSALWRTGISSSRHRCSQGITGTTNLIRCLATTRPSEASVVKPEEDFFVKNKRLNRPMSPHLTIYQPQITTMMSITHRATGLALSGLTAMLAAGTLLSTSSFPELLASVEAAQCGSAAIFVAKYILAFPLVFHTLNGIRHLAWDLGKGFELKQVYVSGYGVLVASVVLAIVLAAM